MKNRFEVFSHFCIFCAKIKTQFNVYVHSLHNDNAKEYFFESFRSYMIQNNIIHQSFCVATSSQNRVVERKNRHFLKTI